MSFTAAILLSLAAGAPLAAQPADGQEREEPHGQPRGGAATAAGVRAFQRIAGLAETGSVDEALRAANIPGSNRAHRNVFLLAGAALLFGAALRALLWVLPNSIFEAVRKPIGPHYWDEEAFSTHLRKAGFTVLK